MNMGFQESWLDRIYGHGCKAAVTTHSIMKVVQRK